MESSVKKILIASGIFSPEIGGPATFSKIILNEYQKSEKIDPIVLSYFLPHHASQDSRVFSVSKFLPKGLRHLIYFYKCLFLSRGRKLVLALDPVSAGLPALLSTFFSGKKFFVRIAGDYAWEEGSRHFGVTDTLDDFQKKFYGLRVEWLRSVQKYVAKKAEKIIVPSEYLKKILVTGWGIGPEKIIIIYNAVDFPDAPVEKSLSVSPTFSLFSAGRLVSWKGFDSLLDLMRELPSSITLSIAGDGPKEQSLRKKIADLDLVSRVFLLGRLKKEDLVNKLKTADLFILNTKYEGFSHQILESLALGVPVITTNIGGNPELVKEGENGFLVAPDDMLGFKKAIEKISTDKSLYAHLSKNALQVRHLFSKNRLITDFENLIKNI